VSALEPSPFERATTEQLASKRFHRTRRAQLRAMPRTTRALRHPVTGRVRQVPVILCPPACGELGSCPVPRPYYPEEHGSNERALETGAQRGSAWKRRVEWSEVHGEGPFVDDDFYPRMHRLRGEEQKAKPGHVSPRESGWRTLSAAAYRWGMRHGT